MSVETRLSIPRSPYNNRTPHPGGPPNITYHRMSSSDGSSVTQEIPLEELVSDVRRELRTQVLGRSIVALASVDSTNRVAREALLEGAPAGTVYLTDHQTQGRGRLGRSWMDAPGQNLLFSVIIALDGPLQTNIPLRAALAVRDAIAPFLAGHEVQVKWPNDVLIDGRKCAGMLLETASRSRSKLVLGIGVNVNQRSFPPDHADTATSLRLVTGHDIERAPLLCRILERLEERLILGSVTGDNWITDYEDVMYRLNHRITLYFPERKTSTAGTIRGVADDGALILEADDGVQQPYYAGDVTTHAIDS